MMGAEVWAWVELEDGLATDAGLEVMEEARRLADSAKAKAAAFVFGPMLDECKDMLAGHGADVVRHYSGGAAGPVDLESQLAAFDQAGDEGQRPVFALFPLTVQGSALAPRFAAHMGCTYIPHTVSVRLSGKGELAVSKAVCLGKAQERFSFSPKNTVVFAFDPGVIGIGGTKPGKACECIEKPLPSENKGRIVSEGVILADPHDVSLDEAERLVSIGNAFNEDDMEMAEELADVLGAAMTGSKPAIDRGLLDHDRMVGQSSGKRLSPALFLAIGVSGSTHYVAGMKDSRCIVAVNKDKGAPIMKMADLAVVGDMHEVIPRAVSLIEASKGKEEGDE